MGNFFFHAFPSPILSFQRPMLKTEPALGVGDAAARALLRARLSRRFAAAVQAMADGASRYLRDGAPLW